MLIKMPVKGKAETQFWVRAFQLEDDIQKIVQMLHEGDPRRRTAFAPTISEHEAGSVFWVFILGISVDALGICDGLGYIWLTTGQEHKEIALRERDKFGDQIIGMVKDAGKYDEVLEIESKKDV